jgi:hypothetical protein
VKSQGLGPEPLRSDITTTELAKKSAAGHNWKSLGPYIQHAMAHGDQTTIVASDDAGREVGRVELQHGPIVLGEQFGELAGTMEAGRQLSVEVDGQTFDWQTVGFDDTRHMPALPAFYFDRVAAFVADEHVRPILDRWLIGWDPAATVTHADHYDECILSGWNAIVINLRGVPGTYPTQGGRTVPACGNGTQPGWQAVVVNQDTQDHVMQCCGATASVGSYSEKTCALTGTCKGGSRAGAVCGENPDCPGSICGNYLGSCGIPAGPNARCAACFTPKPYSGYCAVGSSEYVHFGQQPHHSAGAAAEDGQFYGCSSLGNQCLSNGVDGDCFGEGWGEGAAPECCSGVCHNYHCSGP